MYNYKEKFPMNSIDHLATYSDLSNKVAIVTGGSRGIGAATAKALALNGAHVAVNGRDTAAIDAIVAEIHAKGGRAIGVAADCTDFSAIEQMRQEIEKKLGSVDVLAAFAGGGIVRPGPLEKV